jgi:3-isopropylmalate dehydratase small subunit
MEASGAHAGRGAAPPRSAAADLLAAWRADPGQVVGRPFCAGATILIAGPGFGAGPAREQPGSEDAAGNHSAHERSHHPATDRAAAECAASDRAAGKYSAHERGERPASDRAAGKYSAHERGERAASDRAAAECAAAECAASNRVASALARHGFMVVISAGFDEIFRNNMTKSGVLPLCLPIGKVAELQDIVEADPAVLLTVDLANREVAIGDRFSAVFEFTGSARWQLPGGLAGAAEAGPRGCGTGESGGRCPAWLPGDGQDHLAGRIRTIQHRISCLDVPVDVRIYLQRRLIAVCDAMKPTGADPVRCERRLVRLGAELDRLAAAHGTGDIPDHIPGQSSPGNAKAQSGKPLNSWPTRP